MILNCNCKHEAQDKLHGPQRRVFTPSRPPLGSSEGAYTCTVCGATKTAAGSAAIKKVKK